MPLISSLGLDLFARNHKNLAVSPRIQMLTGKSHDTSRLNTSTSVGLYKQSVISMIIWIRVLRTAGHSCGCQKTTKEEALATPFTLTQYSKLTPPVTTTRVLITTFTRKRLRRERSCPHCAIYGIVPSSSEAAVFSRYRRCPVLHITSVIL